MTLLRRTLVAVTASSLAISLLVHCSNADDGDGSAAADAGRDGMADITIPDVAIPDIQVPDAVGAFCAAPTATPIDAGAALLVGSCLRPGDAGTPATCTQLDAIGSPVDQGLTRATCFAPGSWTTDACSHAGALGGCRRATDHFAHCALVETTWYFPGSGQATAADVQAACSARGLEFVAP